MLGPGHEPTKCLCTEYAAVHASEFKRPELYMPYASINVRAYEAGVPLCGHILQDKAFR